MKPVHISTSVSFLLLGAGSGQRLGGCSKAFIPHHGATLLEHALHAIAGMDGDILVGLRSGDVRRGQSVLGSRASVLSGGQTRQETINLLVSQASGSIVVVHDIARPFARPALFQAVIAGARKHGACAAVVPNEARDSLCRNENGFAGAMVDRSTLMQIQTPQAFDRKILVDVLNAAENEGRDESSLISLCRAGGYPVKLVDGDRGNIKVTYPGDLPGAAIATAAG